MSARVAGVSGAVLLLAVATFQIALILGMPWGALTQGGIHSGTLSFAGRVVAAVSAVLLVGMAFSLLARIGRGPFRRLPARVIAILALLTTAYAAVGVVMNAASRSAPERWTWTPVTLLVLACCAVVMWGTRTRRSSGTSMEA